MKTFVNYVVATWLALTSLSALAALEGGQLAPEPTVNVAWVGVFLLLFIGVCVFIGVAIYRAEGKRKQDSNES